MKSRGSRSKLKKLSWNKKNFFRNGSIIRLLKIIEPTKKLCSENQFDKEWKKLANFKKIGLNPSPKTFYTTPKSTKRQSHSNQFAPEANKTNKHFPSKGSVLDAQTEQQKTWILLNRVEISLLISPTKAQEVAELLKSSKNKKSTGQDGTSNKILKCCSAFLGPVLPNIFIESVQISTYPTWLKWAKIALLFKKGDKNRLEHHSPINLISSVSKVFEELFWERMMSFCQNQKVLNESQFGFRSKMSWVQAMVTEFLRQRVLRFTLEYEILWKNLKTMVSEKKTKKSWRVLWVIESNM